jgi:hypothetical protein
MLAPVFTLAALLGAVLLACWFERLARHRKVERPRASTAGLALVLVTAAILFACLELEPAEGVAQPVMFLLLPLFAVCISVVHFPDGISPRDATCVVGIFVVVGAAAVHQFAQYWRLTMDEKDPILRTVRRATTGLSTAAILLHALLMAVRQCDGLWAYSRASIAFAGGLRLVAAVVLHVEGVRGTNFPPGWLSLPSSLLVNTSYLALALFFTERSRRKFSHAVLSACDVGRFIGSTEQETSSSTPPASPASPASPPVGPNDGSCAICMNGTKDHAFIPCGHICACAACARVVLRHGASEPTCPMCRVPITSMLRTFHV